MRAFVVISWPWPGILPILAQSHAEVFEQSTALGPGAVAGCGVDVSYVPGGDEARAPSVGELSRSIKRTVGIVFARNHDGTKRKRHEPRQGEFLDGFVQIVSVRIRRCHQERARNFGIKP